MSDRGTPVAGWEVLKTLPAGSKLFFIVFILTVLLTFLSLLACSSLLVLSALGKDFAPYWRISFLCCLASLLGWMIPCFVERYWGRGIHVNRKSVVAFWLAVLATVLSAFFAFESPVRYLVIAAVAGSVGLFSYDTGIFVYGLLPSVWKQIPGGQRARH